MPILKRLGRSALVMRAAASLAALVFRFIRVTTRYEFHPPDIMRRLEALGPFIATTWHGQHFMLQVARPTNRPFFVMISRHRDGELNAMVARKLGAQVIRGSGGEGQDIRRKGGISASREVLRVLENNGSVVMTADVPKTARIAGQGIIMLAQHSSCPIIPAAIVSRRRRDFSTWDSMSLPLPFTRGAVFVGEPLYVPADADEALLEQKRLDLQQALNRLHAAAYGALGAPHKAFAEPRS